MSANKLAGEIEIVLDHPRKLKLTFRGMAKFEEWTGKTVEDYFLGYAKRSAEADSKATNVEKGIAMLRDLSIRTISALLAAMLLHEAKDMTPDEASDLMEYAKGTTGIEKMTHVLEKTMEVWMARQGINLDEINAKMKEVSAGDAARPSAEGSRLPDA